MGNRVLIVDDERDLPELLAYNLQRVGYTTEVVHDGLQGIERVNAFHPDLIVLDVMMPGISGVEVAERLRREPRTRHIPILMLTARADEASELEGLHAGADDYVAKPFSMKVLEARIEALLRRRREAPNPPALAPTSLHTLGPVQLNTDTHEALLDARPLSLTVTEFRILESLISAGGRVLSRQALITRALGPGVTVTERTIDVHVTSIRKKLGDHAPLLRTVRGVGYRLVADAAEIDDPAATGAQTA